MALIPILIVHLYLFSSCIIHYFLVEGSVKLKLVFFSTSFLAGFLLSWANVFISILFFSGQTISAYGLFFFVLLGPIPILFLCVSWFFYNQADAEKSICKASIGLTFCLAVVFSTVPWFCIGSYLVEKLLVSLTY